jgi:hypothetical protein
LINYYFDNDTVQEIFRTPLFHQVEEDDMVWKAEKNGQYSVRSAYRLCIEDVADNSHLHRIGSWDNIWRLKVPPKVKNLIWRICRGCLPTRARLLDKGENAPLYVVCVMKVMRIRFMFYLIARVQEMFGSILYYGAKCIWSCGITIQWMISFLPYCEN